MGVGGSRQVYPPATPARLTTPEFIRAPSHRFKETVPEKQESSKRFWNSAAAPGVDQEEVVQLEILAPGVQDVLRRRTAMVSGAGPSGSLAAAAVLATVNGHISKLARIVVRHAPQQCAGEPYEAQAETLTQEYIRFLILQMIEIQNPSGPNQPSLSHPLLISKLWVSHILETQSYSLLCQHLVPGGCAIHYSKLAPPLPETPDRMTYTLEAYRYAFNSEPPMKWWSDNGQETPRPTEESPASAPETPRAAQLEKG